MVNLREKARQKLGVSFLAELDKVASRLKIPSIWLLGIMDSESDMNPRANNAGTNADGSIDYGLIQFNGTHTLPQYGITGNQLTNMTATQQLAYIERYYKPTIGKVKRFGDLYLWNLSPAYFLNSPNHPTATAFKNKVEQAYTKKNWIKPHR